MQGPLLLSSSLPLTPGILWDYAFHTTPGVRGAMAIGITIPIARAHGILIRGKVQEKVQENDLSHSQDLVFSWSTNISSTPTNKL